MHSLYRLISIIALIGIFNISSTTLVNANNKTTISDIATGYRVLKIFLEDEEYLTTIRRAKMIVTFSDISDDSGKLIDEISSSSEQALDELDDLAQQKPVIVFENFPDEMIAIATLDSLRMTAAKEFLFESENFEKNLLLSQIKVLPVISHLAQQLEEKETVTKRKKWLNKLAKRYEKYYQQVNNRILLSNKKSLKK